MAENSIIFLFLTLSVFPLTLSHTSTTFFDVSDSLQQAQNLLQLKPTKFHDNEEQRQIIDNNSSSFSLHLHPREALFDSRYTDYNDLVLARLERDSARVNSLSTKLQLALDNVQLNSDLKPLSGSENRPDGLKSPLVSGESHGSGEYFARVSIGQPGKPFYMVPDTGSDVTWLQCRACSDCYQQTEPIFDPSTSASFRSLSCESQQCRALEISGCRNSNCQYKVSYGDGSYTVGDLATETLSFGSSGSVNDIAIGCGHDNKGLFTGSAGLIGLGGGSLSLNSQIKASSFSYCFVDRDSTASSTLEFNSVKPGDSVTAPFIKNSKVHTFYYVGVIGMSVGGQKLDIPPSLFQVDQASGRGGIIVDSGTVITRLQTQAYDALRDSFVRQTSNLTPASGVSIFDTCYDLSSESSVRVPTVSFQFSGGGTLRLPAKNYLILTETPATYCFAFAPTSLSVSIIGNFQQQGIRVSYDLANSQVGFSADKC